MSTAAWSTATCWGVAFLVESPAASLELAVPVGSVVPLPVALLEVPEDAPGPELDPPEMDGVVAGAADEPDVASMAAATAFSSCSTCFTSAATRAWACVAWVRAAEQEGAPLPPEAGAVVEVVEDDEAQTEVASWRAVPARTESVSSWVWSEVSSACNLATEELSGDEPDPRPEPAGTVVVVVVGAAWDVVDVDVVAVAVSLASALATEAWAEANDAWADSTAALRSATSSEASVWPAPTVWPTVTSTSLTVPETLKLRLAWLTGVMVPTESRVSSTVPVPTSVVR